MMFPMTPLSVGLMIAVFIVVVAIFAICIRRELR
jgi:hypothetical protein